MSLERTLPELKAEDKQDWLWEERCFFWGKIAEDKGTMGIKAQHYFHSFHVPPNGRYFTVSVTFAEFWNKPNSARINKHLLTLYPPEAKGQYHNLSMTIIQSKCNFYILFIRYCAGYSISLLPFYILPLLSLIATG